ncbi:MAG: MaoC family dehydratase [Betaproteobacteria bacterium]|jgi:acyl dehydratase
MDGPVHSISAADLAARAGTELGSSAWMPIDQAMVDAFADLTQDTYFIHVDPDRAKATAFGGTIAHGFLTLSLLSCMAYQVCPFVEGTRNGVNYGFNRLRFVAPVPVGARVRGRFVLKSFDLKDTRWQATWEVTVEIESTERPAIVAEWITAGLF